MMIKTGHSMRRVLRLSFLLSAVIMALLIVPRNVHAASQRVTVNDGSGKYLLKIRSSWYLKKRDGSPCVGLQYLSLNKAGNLSTGYYVFDKAGRLIDKKTVCKFEQKKVHNVTFNGFYYVASTGRIYKAPRGLIYLKGLKCAGITFNGYYYADTYGKLNNPSPKMRYINKVTVQGKTFRSGYYCFNNTGKLYMEKGFRKIAEQTTGKRTFKGFYYFDGNGRLYTKEGILTVGRDKYYLTEEGKMLASAWKNGQYYLSNGKMATSMMTPDGTWVDENGRKIESSAGRLLKLKKNLNTMIAGYGGTWSVYVKDLKTNDTLIINDRPMYAASTIKAFAMAEAFDLISRKKLSYDAQVRSLLNAMITVSDNTAFNQLVMLMGNGDFLKGAAVLNKYLKETGYKGTELHHTTAPASNAYITDGNRNKASAKDCGALLENIYRGTCVNKTCSKQMMDLLRRQTRTWKIPAALPASAVVANKTGETSEVQHDIAIVKGPKTDYIICVFSTTSESAGIQGIRGISKAVWDYLE